MPFDFKAASIKSKAEFSSSGYAFSDPASVSPFTYQGGLKRLFDITLVMLSLPIVLPVIALMALLVAMDGYSPFYTQRRVGRGGRAFSIVKMRTMVNNADRLLEEHLERDPALRAEWDATQKLKKDVRITWIGRFLRKTSLDELPQLFNVLEGTMSLVGPRPMMLDQQELYPGQAYYSLRPGITGFWQISDRNQCNFCDRAKYDSAYARSVSLSTDIAVLWQTLRVVVRGTGY